MISKQQRLRINQFVWQFAWVLRGWTVAQSWRPLAEYKNDESQQRTMTPADRVLLSWATRDAKDTTVFAICWYLISALQPCESSEDSAYMLHLMDKHYDIR